MQRSTCPPKRSLFKARLLGSFSLLSLVGLIFSINAILFLRYTNERKSLMRAENLIDAGRYEEADTQLKQYFLLMSTRRDDLYDYMIGKMAIGE